MIKISSARREGESDTREGEKKKRGKKAWGNCGFGDGREGGSEGATADRSVGGAQSNETTWRRRAQ